jgi:hypothetical protein
MTLAQLKEGRRFEVREARHIRGTLVKLTEGSALVELDGKPEVCDFETAEGWKRINTSGKRRTRITPFVEVNAIN